jgi:hypothetical protein
VTERHESGKLNANKAHCFMNNSRIISSCLFNRLNQSLFVFSVCAVVALANAADPDDQIYEKSPDERFGFRDSFVGAAKTEQSEMPVMAIDVVEISSKRVVLRSPKEALTPIHLRREPQAWSNDSKHIARSFQTGPRTWTAKLYEWDGKEFAEVSWPRDAIRKRIEEEQAAQLKALGLPESTPRKLVYEGFTALGWVDATLWWVDFTSTRQGNEGSKAFDWVDPTAVKMIAERIDSVVVSKDLPPAELDVRFTFVIKTRDPQKTEIADVTKIIGTSGYGDVENVVQARLADEQPESSYLVKDVEEGQQPFRLYALERFTVVGEKGNDYVVEDGCDHEGRIPRRLVHKFPSAFVSDEMDGCAVSRGIDYHVLLKVAQSGYLPALRALFALGDFDGAAADIHSDSVDEIGKFVSARQISEAQGSFSAAYSGLVKPSKSSANRRGKRTDFSQVLAKADACARLVDENSGGFSGSMLVARVPTGQKPFKLYGGEYFAITGEKDGDYLIEDPVGNQGYVAKDFVEMVPKPTTESAMLLPLMGLHYLRVVKGTQSERDSPDTRRLMLSLDLTGQSGAEHARNLERMLDHDDALSLLLKEFSPARVKAIRAMLLQGRAENHKAELIRKYPLIFHGHAPSKSPAK